MSKRPTEWYYQQQPDAMPAPEAAQDVASAKMLDAQRVLGGSRMIRTETPTETITDEQVQTVIEVVKAYIKQTGCGHGPLIKALCLSSTTVSQVLGGKYNADVRPIVAAMDRWLERRKESDARPSITSFVWIDVAKEIRMAAKLAIAAADQGLDSRIALVYGDPGCGKSLALEAIAESENAIHITCGTDVMSARAIMEKIGEALRIAMPRGTSDAFGEIVKKLRGSGKLIIVDEIHALLDARDDTPFHMLRRLSDQTGVPQLWAATCDLMAILSQRQTRREPLGQITRRFACQKHLTRKLHSPGGGKGLPDPLYTVEQVLKIYGSNEMKLTSDGAEFLASLCRNWKLGLLGTCTTLVAHATTMYRGKSATINAQMLWEAATFLFNDNLLEQLQASVEVAGAKRKFKFA
jgi:DNA transposition AAA+ family ATPase